jgi:hypothetical protein
MSKWCVAYGDTCWGVELMNEPGFVHGGLDRSHLLAYYQTAIKAARAAGLPEDKPVVIMEWMAQYKKYWAGNWDKFFPKTEYGTTVLDTHLYIFNGLP